MLPTLLIQQCQSQKRPFYVITFESQPKPEEMELADLPHLECRLGAVGKVVDTFKKHDIDELVMVGHLSKPSLFDLRPDLKGVKILASLLHYHDDALLSKVCHYLEDEGFKIVGAHDVIPELLSEKKNYTKHMPRDDVQRDIALGVEAALALGSLDIGQAVVVKDGVILGVEGVEGTSALIERCAALRGKKGQGGILVKCAKPQQNQKVDMPTVGLKTMKQLAEHHYSGLAILEKGALLVDSDAMVKFADQEKLFLCGVDENGQYA